MGARATGAVTVVLRRSGITSAVIAGLTVMAVTHKVATMAAMGAMAMAVHMQVGHASSECARRKLLYSAPASAIG